MLTDSPKRAAAAYAAAFLLCGTIHVLLYGVSFADSAAQLFCGVVVVLWARSVHRRITDDRLGRMLTGTAVLMLLYVALQIMRYELCEKGTAFHRLLWYAFYVPMSGIPLMCFLTAQCVHRPRSERLPRFCTVLVVLAGLLAIGFLTNDLHHQAFRFPTGVQIDNGDERHGWLWFLCCGWFALLMVLSLAVTARKCREIASLRRQALSSLPFAAMSVLLLLSVLGLRPRLNGIDLWKDAQILIFGVLGFLESCIQIGLIPANRHYERLFALSDLPAVIVDDEGQPVYRTTGARWPFREDADTRVEEHAIRGGRILWETDIAPLRALNERLEEAIQQIRARNAYLAEESRIRQERAELETRSRLYDAVSRIVQPQLAQIESRIQAAESEKDFSAQLARAAVLCAYVKRRSNMELMAADVLGAEELTAAIAESLENLRLCGVSTALQSAGAAEYPADMLTAAYEHFEDIVEACLDALSDLLTVVRAEEDRLTLRMLLQADAIEYQAPSHASNAGFSRQLTVTTDHRDTIVTLTLVKGGGNA